MKRGSATNSGPWERYLITKSMPAWRNTSIGDSREAYLEEQAYSYLEGWRVSNGGHLAKAISIALTFSKARQQDNFHSSAWRQ